MSTTTPFLRFEDKFHFLSQLVSQSQQKLPPESVQAIADLAVGDLCKSFFEFCGEQFKVVRKLRPTVIICADIGNPTDGKEINDLFRFLVGKSLISMKETIDLRVVSRRDFRLPNDAAKRKIRNLEWTAISDSLLDLAIRIARESSTAAKQGLDPKSKKHSKTIAALDRLLVARYDSLI